MKDKYYIGVIQCTIERIEDKRRKLLHTIEILNELLKEAER